MNENNYPEDWHKISSFIINSQNSLDEAKSLKEVISLYSKITLQIEEMHTDKKISTDLFNFLKNKCYCDASLIKLRKLNGFRNLCCTSCINKLNKEKVCVCRVPKLIKENFEECNLCGCKGCSDKKIKFNNTFN